MWVFGNLFPIWPVMHAQSNAISEMKQIRSWSNPNRGRKESPINIVYFEKTLFSKYKIQDVYLIFRFSSIVCWRFCKILTRKIQIDGAEQFLVDSLNVACHCWGGRVEVGDGSKQRFSLRRIVGAGDGQTHREICGQGFVAKYGQ